MARARRPYGEWSAQLVRRQNDTPNAATISSELASTPVGSTAVAQHSNPDALPASGQEEAAQLLIAVSAALKESMSLFAWRGFLEPLRPAGLAFDGDVMVLALYAPTDFLTDWVRTHYQPALEEQLARSLGRPPGAARVTLETQPGHLTDLAAPMAAPTTAKPRQSASTSTSTSTTSGASSKPAPRAAPTPSLAPSLAPSLVGPARVRQLREDGVVSLAPTPTGRRRLDPRYTFDSFVTGPGSQMAYAAASSVATHPGARYSPLFLFGPTGLGKTHLLHAVGHEILERHGHLRVALLSAEQWVNEFINDAHERKFEAFRRRYRDDVDVLLIDDIQFLAGKSQSQDEFFHTFNALYESHKQIVVTSDRYPHEIAGLEDRLKTRFQWGLVADVRPPDADTRRAILARKAIDLGCALPTDVLDFVAASVTTSVRALEGALTRLVAWSQLTREPLSLDEAKEQLRPTLTAGAQSPMSVGRIIDVVGTYHGMRAKDLTGPSRQRQVTRARQIAMFLARQHLQMSLPELGRAFGGRDHTTVLASVQKIDKTRVDDASLQAILQRLEQTLF